MKRFGSYNLALAATGAIAVLLRLWNLGGLALWYDESITASVAQNLLSGAGAVTGRGTDYARVYLHIQSVALSIRSFGFSEASVRLPSAVAGILVVVAVWALARVVADKRVALLSAAFVAVMPYLVASHREARSYSYAQLFALLAVLLYWYATDAENVSSLRRRMAAIAFVVLLPLAYMSHELIAVTVASLGVYSLVRVVLTRRERDVRNRHVLALGSMALAGTAAIVAVALGIAPSPPLGFMSSFPLYWYPALIVYSFPILVAGLGAVLVLRRLSLLRTPQSLLLLANALVPILVFALFRTPNNRYASIAIPFAVILCVRELGVFLADNDRSESARDLFITASLAVSLVIGAATLIDISRTHYGRTPGIGATWSETSNWKSAVAVLADEEYNVILTPSTASMWTYFPDAETLSLRTSGTQQTRALAEDIDTLLSQQDVVVVADRHRFEAFVDEEIRVLLLSRMVQVETKSDSMMLVLREYRETQ